MPTTHRPPKIASPAWAAELYAALGLDAHHAHDLVTLATNGACITDPHQLQMRPRVAAETERFASHGLLREAAQRVRTVLGDEPREHGLVAAGWLLFHQDYPSYAALMNLRHDVWWAARELERHDLQAWLMRQYASMIVHGPDEVRESAWYSLGVDYFEDTRDSALVLPRLSEALGSFYWGQLTRKSLCAGWPGKRELYRRLREDPSRHAVLADALVKSCVAGFLGAIDIPEARAMALELELEPELRERLARAMRAEVELELLAVAHDGERVLINLGLLSIPTWFEGSVVLLGDQVLGHIVRFRAAIMGPSEAAWREQLGEGKGQLRRVEDLEQRSYNPNSHTVDGDPEAWLAALGQRVRLCATLPCE